MSTCPKASLIQRCAVALAVVAAVGFAFLPAAHAQQGPTQRWVPQGGHHHHHVHPPVLLGFTGQGVGYGVEVMRVNYGSAADRLGLEREYPIRWQAGGGEIGRGGGCSCGVRCGEGAGVADVVDAAPTLGQT